MSQAFRNFLVALGVQPGMPLLVHASFRKIRAAFPGMSPARLITSLQGLLAAGGSLIFPTFTYCFKRVDGQHEIYDREHTPARVGAVAEAFRKMPGVIRTASPTHSFALWGIVQRAVGADNAPVSPLGHGSVLEWLAQQQNAHILLLGTDFSALSFGHYLEILAPVPWHEFSPWTAQGYESIGVATWGEQQLIQVPGCSRSFVSLQSHLLQHRCITPRYRQELETCLLPVPLLLLEGLRFFREQPLQLLCPAGSCAACDTRRAAFPNAGAMPPPATRH